MAGVDMGLMRLQDFAECPLIGFEAFGEGNGIISHLQAKSADLVFRAGNQVHVAIKHGHTDL